MCAHAHSHDFPTHPSGHLKAQITKNNPDLRDKKGAEESHR